MFILQLGPRIAEILLEMFADGLKVDLFHLVGHSLGAQLSGIVSRNVISKSNGTQKIARYDTDTQIDRQAI